jgi:hypothetical protein
MTAEQLMKPRFEVIAEFPNMKSYNIISVGNIITDDGINVIKDQDNRAICVIDFEKYPHLFRKLNWWEHRKIEDMPKRLICKAIPNDTEIMEIQEWDMDILVGWLNKKERKCCSLTVFSPAYGYFPID